MLTETGHEECTYELTGPEAFSDAEIAHKISALLGKDISIIDLSDTAMWRTRAGAGVPRSSLHWLITLGTFYRQGGGSVVTPWVEIITGNAARTLNACLEENLKVGEETP